MEALWGDGGKQHDCQLVSLGRVKEGGDAAGFLICE